MAEDLEDVNEKLAKLSDSENDSGKEADSEEEKKHQRLAGRSPLKTLFALSFGPLMGQLSGSLYGFINSWWLSRAMGELGLTAISISLSLDFFGRAFGFLLSVAASTKIAALFATGDDAECPQIICDLLRVALIFGVFVPCVTVPTISYVFRWFGASDEIVHLGFLYVLPIFLGSVFTCCFLCLSGSLQAEGRTTFVGVSTLVALLFSVFALVPLFIFGFKMGVFGAGLATILGETIIFIFFLVQYLRGKFNVKPKFNQFFKKFGPHTSAALKVGMSQLFSNLSSSIPATLMRKLMGNSSNTEQEFNYILAGLNVNARICIAGNALMVALGTGYLPAASYAYAAKNHGRFLKLTVHLIWVCLICSTALYLVIQFFAREISMLFGHDEEYLYWSERCLHDGNYGRFLSSFEFNWQVILQSQGLGIRGSIMAIVGQFLSTIVFLFVLYYSFPNNPSVLMSAWPLTWVFGFFLGVFLSSKPLYEQYKLWKKQKVEIESEVDEKNALDPLVSSKMCFKNEDDSKIE